MKRIDNFNKKRWYNFQHFYYDQDRGRWDVSYFNDLRLPGGFFEMTPEEFEILKEGPKFKEIKDGDTIFITKNTKFPKLFIGESGVPLKRTTVTKKADVIVVPNSVHKVFKEIREHGELVYVIPHTPDDDWMFVSCSHLREVGLGVEDLKRDYLDYYWPGNYGDPVLSYFLPRDLDSEYLMTDKLTTFDSLYHYMNSKMTKVIPEMRSNILRMLRSKDQLQMKLAIDMLKTLDLSGILFDVVWAITLPHNSYNYKIWHYIPNSIKNSVNFKYIKACLGCTGRYLASSYGGATQTIIYNLVKNNLLNEEELFRARVGLQILFYRGIEEELDCYNKKQLRDVGLPEDIDDTDGKATACYRELAD